jgi:quercetin dioxygenase-like cupin family protein
MSKAGFTRPTGRISISGERIMIIKKLSDAGIMDNAHGVDARNLYNRNEAMITVITLEPGQALKRHITPVDVAFYVLEGTGVVEIGDEKMEVSVNTLIESPKDIVHCWYNDSGGPLRFMVVKAPKPTKKTVFIGE